MNLRNKLNKNKAVDFLVFEFYYAMQQKDCIIYYILYILEKRTK